MDTLKGEPLKFRQMESIVSKLKIALMMVGIFIVAAGVGLGSYMFLAREKPVVYEIKTLRIDDMFTNLASGTMAKISVSVVVNQESNSDNSTDEALRDAIVSYLRTVDKAELEGVAGLDYLKSNLLSGARHALGADNVKEIYIRDFVVQ